MSGLAAKAAYDRAYWLANRVRRLAQKREWRAANTEARAVRYAAEREKAVALNKAWHLAHPEWNALKHARRKAARLERTPTWADHAAIEAVYQEAAFFRAIGIDAHVDHFYPLQGKLVSGLHVHNNLRVILAEDNIRKSNKMPEGETR